MASLPAPRPEMSWNDSVSWALLTFRNPVPEKRTSSIGASVRRTSTLRDLRTARFADVYERWTSGEISQAHAAHLLGVTDRTFRRYVARYRKLGLKGLEDRRTAPDEEVTALLALYAERYPGWPIRKFHRAYTELHEGTRSRTWVQRRLRESGLVTLRRSTQSTPERGGRKPAEGDCSTRLVAVTSGCRSGPGSWWHWSMTRAIGFTPGSSWNARRSGADSAPSMRPSRPTGCLTRFT